MAGLRLALSHKQRQLVIFYFLYLSRALHYV